MLHYSLPKRFFWLILLLFLLLSSMKISETFANGGGLVINEFVASNDSGLVDEDGDHADWIEIYNHSDQPVNLAGWALTDDPNLPAKWTFPDITLPAEAYLIVFASGKNRQAIEPGTALHTNFKLSKAGDFLGLFNFLENRFMDQVQPQYPEQFEDVSYGRIGSDVELGYLARPTPGGPNDESLFWTGAVAPVEFSVPRGFFKMPFELTLSTVTPETTIYYTTDGSQPSAAAGMPYTGPISIEGTTTLRAIAVKAGALPSPNNAHTYIFTGDVLAQPAQPPGFPADWGTALAAAEGQVRVSPTAADYAMDPDIVNDPAYSQALKSGLTALPALSLVLDSPDLTALHTPDDDAPGEQPVLVEYILPDEAGSGFQIEAGLRLHQPSTLPKQSFRLSFKRDYGAPKLEYPLFSDSANIEFDSLLLLAGEGDNFVAPNSAMRYTGSAWLRESQLAMSSGFGPHSRFVHLYINGLYWGLYNLAERPDASFMAENLGGEKADWFMANRQGSFGDSEGTARLDDLFTMLDLTQRVGGSPDSLADIYAEIGTSLDPVQLSDALILSWYAGLDSSTPGVEWAVGIHRQEVGGRLGKLLLADASNIFANSAGVFDQSGSDPTGFDFNQALFNSLSDDPDFRMHLADRLYLHLSDDGALTDAAAQARWQQLSQAIDPAIVAESARWGDVGRQTPLTHADWLAAEETTLDQIEGRAERLLAAAREAGYYPAFDPPIFDLDGGLVEAGFTLSMSRPESCPACVIYYTTTGSDPRLPVTGDVFPEAEIYSKPVVLTTSTQVKARLFNPALPDQPWSALHQATFNVVAQDTRLRLTEVMYNPLGGDDYEFIELKNVGSSPAALANITVDEGVRFLFPPNAPPLAPGQFTVLVSSRDGFAERYPGVTIGGVYEGHLSNKGEKVTLWDARGQLLLEFEYNDSGGWPVSPDGRGDSLVLVRESGDPRSPKSWRASANLHGSPGADEPAGSLFP